MDKYKRLRKQTRRFFVKQRTCLNKKAYDTSEEAYQKGQDSYKCKYCNKWHRSGKMARLIASLRKQII